MTTRPAAPGPGSAGPDAPTSGDTTCRACGEPAATEPLQLREMMFGTRQSFPYRRCQACFSLSIDTIPTDLGRFYPPTYYANSARQDVRQDPAWRRALIRSLVARRAFGRRSPVLPLARRLARVPDEYRDVRALIDGGGLSSFDDPVLDVGCGAEPVRLAILRKLGFRRLMGIEPYIDTDTTYKGVPVRKGFLGDVDGRFRLIMFHHSLEHVPDPLETLRQAAARSAPDGRCLVRTPIADGYFWRTYGTDWVELDAPRHLVVFSRLGLERLARRAGFAIVGVTWENGAWEFVASEQYRADVAMYEPGSWFEDKSDGGFDEARLAAFREEGRRRVEAGDAGRAAVWLRPIADPAG